MPWTWEREPRIVSYAEEEEPKKGDDGKQTNRVETQDQKLRSDRVALIAKRIATKRCGAKVQVGEADVRMALAGKDTVQTRCMALSLREIDEGELRTWMAHGLITREELQRCQALDPRKQ